MSNKKQTIIVDDLQVSVTYRVGLGNVEMPVEVYEELLNIWKCGDTVEMGDVHNSEALTWLTKNIEEGDCCDWEAEIEEITDIHEEEED